MPNYFGKKIKSLSSDDIINIISKDGEFCYGPSYWHDVTDVNLEELTKLGLIKKLIIDKPNEMNADYRYVFV